jgi:hypothetical protein
MSFNTKTVVKLVGLTQRQIDYWDRGRPWGQISFVDKAFQVVERFDTLAFQQGV